MSTEVYGVGARASALTLSKSKQAFPSVIWPTGVFQPNLSRCAGQATSATRVYGNVIRGFDSRCPEKQMLIGILRVSALPEY